MSWCPVEFSSITVLLEETEIQAHFLSKVIQEGNELLGTAFPGEDAEEIDKWDIPLVIQNKLIENFLNHNANKAVACSPTGTLFRVNRVLMRPPIYNHWYSFDERFRRHPDLLYVDIWTGLFDLHGVEKRMNSWSEFPDSAKWQDEALSRFSHLNGWSVCFHRDDVDLSQAGIAKLWTPHSPEKSPTTGRPLLALDAARAFREVYPQGRGSTPWSEVEDKVARRMGRATISGKTIIKGLRAITEKTPQNEE